MRGFIGSLTMTRHGAWLALVLIVLGGGLVGRAVYKQVRWKRFAVVEQGGLYRSGQLTAEHFGAALEQLELKSVVCLNDEFVERERSACAARGVQFFHMPMPADGRGAPDQFAAFLGLVNDARYRPMLVHCSAGVARTGACIALHRVAHHGWNVEQALAELASFERRGRCETKLRQHVAELARHLPAMPVASPANVVEAMDRPGPTWGPVSTRREASQTR